MEGDWLDYKPGADGDRKMVIDTMETATRECVVLRRKDIPEICTYDIKAVLSNYYKSCKYGLPYTGHWALEPCIAMDIIWALDNEDALIRRRGKDGD